MVQDINWIISWLDKAIEFK